VSPRERLGHGVAAGWRPGAAAQQPAQREVGATAGTVPGEGFDCVRTAARVEPASRWEEGRNRLAVELDGEQEDPGDRAGPWGLGSVVIDVVVVVLGGGSHAGHTADPWSGAASAGRVGLGTSPAGRRDDRSPSRRSAASRSDPSSALEAVDDGGNARTTNAVPAGSVPSLAETR